MSEEQGAGAGLGELEAVRAVVLQAYPDAVRELIGGESIAELLASVEPARQAFARIAEEVSSREPGAPPPVPAGAATMVVDPGTLPAHELIRRGVRGRRTG